MTKKAIITISLVLDAEHENNKVLATQILNAISVNALPFCSRIEDVEIDESEAADTAKALHAYGLSETAAINVVGFYS